jgi:hypothetical protein
MKQKDEKGTTSFGNEIKENYSPLKGAFSGAVKYMSNRF